VTKTSGRWEQNLSYGSGPRAPTGIDSSSREFGVVLVWRKGREAEETAAGLRTCDGPGRPDRWERGARDTRRVLTRSLAAPCFGSIRAPASAGGPLRQAGSLGRCASERANATIRSPQPTAPGIWAYLVVADAGWEGSTSVVPLSSTSAPHHRIYRNNPPGHIYTEYMSMACVGSFFFQLVLFASWLIVVFFRT